MWNGENFIVYYVHDGNKNVSEVVAYDRSLAAHYEYASFGTVTVSFGISAASNPWRFSSEYAEDEIGVVYYNYRHYEFMMGRWQSMDPSEEEEHPYRYCDNDLDHDVLGLLKFDRSCLEIEQECRNDCQKVIEELKKIDRKYIPKKYPYRVISPDDKRRKKEWKMKHKEDPLWKQIIKIYKKRGLIDGKGKIIPSTIWRDSNMARESINRIRIDLGKGRTIVTCCPDFPISMLCSGTTSGGYIQKGGTFWGKYVGKIVVCPKMMEKPRFAIHGGCGCFMLHELMHKYVMAIPTDSSKRQKYELPIENSMIEIQRVLLQH
jgi:RHS repeat-associated protein